MRRVIVSFILMTFCSSQMVLAEGWTGRKPRLIVVMVIDQFRADYLNKFRGQFGANGFQALIKSGAYYPVAEYDVLQSMTGPGHATILTGAYPYQMGIPINEWYDQEQHQARHSVQDDSVQSVGGKDKKGSCSPRQLVGSTVGDELKNFGLASHVVGVSIKARAAILLGGHRADLAIWMEDGKWGTSTYYRPDKKLPKWVSDLNTTPLQKCDLGANCGIEATTQAAIAALRNEKLGQGSAPDILAISFSTHDITGHNVGPDAPEMKGLTLAEDKAIAEIRSAVTKSVPGGLNDVVFVLTGDHGVAPMPELAAKNNLEAGRIDENVLHKKMEEALREKFGTPKKGDFVGMDIDFNFYLDEANVAATNHALVDFENVMKTILLNEGHFAQVMTRAEAENHLLPPGQIGRQAAQTFYRGRSGHVVGVQKPFFVNIEKKANHMTGYSYDRSVPLIISGMGIKPGVHSEKAMIIDVAPTLSFLLGILPPALNEGRVLSEALRAQ